MPNFEELFSRIISEIKNELNPIQLILYGSRANGTANLDSDFDFVAVVPEFDSSQRAETMLKLSARLWKELDVEVQVWVYSQEQFEERKNEFSSVPEIALSTGVEVNLG